MSQFIRAKTTPLYSQSFGLAVYRQLGAAMTERHIK